jgi:RNA polymerase sigma-70 factor (ECF subfamily)
MATAVTGDDNFAATLTEHIPYLRRYARGLTHNVADADDLVQSCLVRALTNMHRFEQNTNLRAWLLTILHNIFIDTVRKRRRARETFEAAGIAADGLSQSANQFHHVQVTELGRAVAQLPPEQRSTLLLVALEDLTYEEAARVTGVPVGTVRSRLSRARQTLLNLVEGISADEAEAHPGLGRMRRALKRRAAAAREREEAERRRLVA